MCILNTASNYARYKKVNMLSKHIIMQAMKWAAYHRHYDKPVVPNTYTHPPQVLDLINPPLSFQGSQGPLITENIYYLVLLT